MYPLIDLREKNIIIVGASKGIGKQTAITLSEIGAKCILISRNEEKLKKVIEELEGHNHTYLCMDVSNIDGIENAIKNIVEKVGKIDGMAYIAGITNDRPLNLLKHDIIEETLRVNYEAFIEFTRCVCKKNNYNSGMRIVGVSSIASLYGAKANTIYASSKAAINAAVRCLAKELANKNIAINAVAPSMIRTDMYDSWLKNNEEDSYQYMKMNSIQYLGVGEKEDVSNAIAFLLSPASRFITGSCLVIDGGGTTA